MGIPLHSDLSTLISDFRFSYILPDHKRNNNRYQSGEGNENIQPPLAFTSPYPEPSGRHLAHARAYTYTFRTASGTCQGIYLHLPDGIWHLPVGIRKLPDGIWHLPAPIRNGPDDSRQMPVCLRRPYEGFLKTKAYPREKIKKCEEKLAQTKSSRLGAEGNSFLNVKKLSENTTGNYEVEWM